ncbi:hypothetical protein [Nocardioides limicola]|uniref:hypothetical protein n=1 Tax=Nocardioides limicola TaxID=2803368 RepID=UPI00193B4BD6|nr:hypothetical protein [Nocardioides sp. DJM-14]
MRPVLIAVYAVFAVAAGARSAVQIGTRFDDAPLAFSLSAFAAAVYLVATVALRWHGPVAFWVATVACLIELIGVLAVGTLSLVRPELFPAATVWSQFGSGYGYLPLVLPVVGLWWLGKVGRTQISRAG